MTVTVTLVLNDYQASNLRTAIDAAMAHEATPNPLTALDSGDWIAEIRHMLPPPGMHYTHRPNRTVQQYVADARMRAVPEGL